MVVVGLGADVTTAERQTGLCALQRLNLRLLVAAQTMDFSGGSRYSATTSQNFASNWGSLESLKVRLRCGLSP